MPRPPGRRAPPLRRRERGCVACPGRRRGGGERVSDPAHAVIATSPGRDSLTNKRDFCPPPCAMYVPCCSIRAVSTAQATPDQHPEQTQIEQRPDFGNIAKRQTRPSPTQSTFSVDGALPGRRCAILAGSMHSPRLAGQIECARTEQGEAAETPPGADQHRTRVDDSATRHAREAVLLGPASVVRSSPHHDQAPSGMRPGAHRPFARPARPEDRGVFILKSAPALIRAFEIFCACFQKSGGSG